MFNPQSSAGPRLVLVVFLIGSWSYLGVSRADVIVLRGGGEVQGKVIRDPARPETVQVLLLKGKTPLTFQAKQISRVIPRPSALDDYVVKKKALQPTAESEFTLGSWCDEKGLDDLASLHYEAAIAHDPSYEPAHEKLGHLKHDDRWFSPEELRQAQGLVKYRGRWMVEAERDRLVAASTSGAAQTGWLRRIKLLRQAIDAGPNNRSREAENDLLKIQDIDAVPGLVKVLGQDTVAMRKLLVRVLGGISGKESSRAIVNVLLNEPDDSIRLIALDELRKREEAEVAPHLIRSLRGSNIRMINRAAWAIGQLEIVSAVPALINALVSSEERVIMPGSEPAPAAAMPGGYTPEPALMAYNGMWGAFLTPPAVAPGAVAFGAYSTPIFTPAQLPGFSSLGINTYSGRGPIPRIVTDVYRNVEVLTALTSLTGQNYEYDVAAWRTWLKNKFNPNAKAARRVPQP